MSIGNVVQKGSTIFVYNEKGMVITSISVGGGSEDGLKGYTSTTVNVRKGNMIFTYNEKGAVITSTSVR